MKRLLAAAVLAAMTLPATGQNPAPPTLAGLVQKAAADLPAGGMVLAEVNRTDATYAAAGRAAPADGIAPEKIIFEIGSISKVFTSLLLAQTVLEGKATLADPIAKYLPTDLTLDPHTAAITLAQLASHTSGLPRLPANLPVANTVDPYATYDAAALHAFLRSWHPEKAAPQPFAYSNLGAGLLGHLLERIHGKSYETLVRERIAAPLGLTDTVITLTAEQQARFAVPHSGKLAVSPWRFDVLAGAGALRSTAADLAKFAQALLSPDSPLAAAWALIREPQATLGGDDRIGLGIFLGQRDGQAFYNHGGGTGGFRTHLELNPATGRAVVLLINNDALDPATLLAAARRPATPPAAGRTETPIDASRLADYPGVYAIDGQGKFTAVLDATGRLRIRLTGQPFLPAYHAGADRFFLKAVAADYQFGRGADGRVDSLTLHQNGRQVPARRTTEPVPAVLFLSADQLKAYAGTYQLAPQVVFEITARAGHLFAKLTGQPALPVFPDRADHFVYDVVDAALSFERDAGGAVTALVLHQNGLDQRAPRQP